MKIREQHDRALADRGRCIFEDRALSHFADELSKRVAALGEQQAGDWIGHGIDRAAEYDIRDEDHVMRYLHVMFILGRDFDSDPEQTWAREILESPTVTVPGARTQFLYETVMGRLALSAERPSEV